MSLAATNQNLSPQPSYPKAEHAESIRVARCRVVVEVALYDRLEPLPGCRHRFVHSLLELLFNFCQLPSHSPAYRVALHRKVPVPVLPADVRESQKVECFRLSFPSLIPGLVRQIVRTRSGALYLV
jgi:hypothetical protein